MRLFNKPINLLVFLALIISILPINAGVIFTNITVFAAAPAPPALEILTNGMPSASVGTSYSRTLSATGGVVPYTWSEEGLPEGFGINSVTGEVYGMSTSAGTSAVHFTVTDSVYGSFSKDMNFTINPTYTSTPFLQGSGYSTGAYEQNAAQPTAHDWTRQSRFVGSAAGELKWSCDLGEEIFYASPAIGADGTIYIGSGNGNLNAVNPDGTLKWTYNSGWDIGTSPAIGEDGTIYIGSADGNLNALNPDGTLKWVYAVPYIQNKGNAVYSSPAIDEDGTIYFGSNNYLLYAVNPDGTMKWTYETGGAIGSSPVIGKDGTIYVGSGDDKLYAINPDGTLEWSYTTDGAIWRAPVIGVDGTIYFGSNNDYSTGSYDFNLYAVNPDGTLKWSYDIGNTMNSAPAIGVDGTIYIGAWNGMFYAINSDGTLKWSYSIMNLFSSSPIIGADGIVYIGSQDNNLYAFNSDGTLKWTYTSGGAVYSSPAIGADGTIYFGDMDSKLYALYKPLTFDTASLPKGEAGKAYSSTLSASGGTPEYTWSAGGLPAGLAIDAETGEVNGSPTAAGTYSVHFTVTDSINESSTGDLTLVIDPAASNDNEGDDDNGGGASNPSHNTPAPAVSSSGDGSITVSPKLNSSTGTASAVIDSKALSSAFNSAPTGEDGVKTVKLVIPKVGSESAYDITLSASFLASGDTKKAVEIKTGIGTVTVPGNMLESAAVVGAQNVSLTIASIDKSKLDTSLQTQIGDRPIIELSLKIDGKAIAWNSGSTHVSVSVPYTPSADELKDPEHITVWYIDGSGNAVSVTSGRYDPATGMVTFTTNHFSIFAVTFVQKSFTDISDYGWAKKQIEVLASKGIINGTSGTAYDPSANISRADFLVLLVRTLGLTVETDSSFSDVKSTDYYYEALGIAKKLGISEGTENNLFSPKDCITRQDMMTMAARAMKSAGKLKTAETISSLERFSDKGEINPYAVEAIAAMVKEGLINGDGSRINPTANATRAETAMLMYRIYNE